MYTLLRSLSLKRLGSEQLPAIVSAWAVAELLYKFKSFTLECLAFLATWFVIDLAIQLALHRGRSAPQQTRSEGT
jgi:hypothetical protein